MKVNDIHKYKKAKVFVKDLTHAQALFAQFVKDIMPYKKYKPVQDAFREIYDSMIWLELHLKHQQKILDSKGLEE